MKLEKFLSYFCFSDQTYNKLFTGVQIKQSYSISAKVKKEITKNEDLVPSSKYTNLNPRNLEKLSIARRDRGWGNGNDQKESTNFPSRFFYHRSVINLFQIVHRFFLTLVHIKGFTKMQHLSF